jgi:hypothetical protein
MARRLVKMDAEIRPLVDRLYAAVNASTAPDIRELVTELKQRARPRPHGPKIKRRLLDRHPPGNRADAKQWIEARLKRLAREGDGNGSRAGLLRVPSDLRRRWVKQLIAEVKRMLPAVRFTVDEFMRQHIRT